MELTQTELDRLACPVCFGPLLLLVAERAIECTACRRRYPIVDGLPVLIAGRAVLPGSN